MQFWRTNFPYKNYTKDGKKNIKPWFCWQCVNAIFLFLCILSSLCVFVSSRIWYKFNSTFFYLQRIFVCAKQCMTNQCVCMQRTVHTLEHMRSVKSCETHPPFICESLTQRRWESLIRTTWIKCTNEWRIRVKMTKPIYFWLGVRFLYESSESREQKKERKKNYGKMINTSDGPTLRRFWIQRTMAIGSKEVILYQKERDHFLKEKKPLFS